MDSNPNNSDSKTCETGWFCQNFLIPHENGMLEEDQLVCLEDLHHQDMHCGSDNYGIKSYETVYEQQRHWYQPNSFLLPQEDRTPEDQSVWLAELFMNIGFLKFIPGQVIIKITDESKHIFRQFRFPSKPNYQEQRGNENKDITMEDEIASKKIKIEVDCEILPELTCKSEPVSPSGLSSSDISQINNASTFYPALNKNLSEHPVPPSLEVTNTPFADVFSFDKEVSNSTIKEEKVESEKARQGKSRKKAKSKKVVNQMLSKPAPQKRLVPKIIKQELDTEYEKITGNAISILQKISEKEKWPLDYKIEMVGKMWNCTINLVAKGENIQDSAHASRKKIAELNAASNILRICEKKGLLIITK